MCRGLDRHDLAGGGGARACGCQRMASSSRSRVLVVQSGATEWDRLGRVQGSADLPLSGAGRADIDQRARQLEGTRLGAVISAPDEASRETANVLAKATGGRVQVDPALGELHLGLWEGLLCSALEAKCKAGKLFLEGGAGIVPPGGTESLDQYQARLLPNVARLIGRRRGDSAVVLRPIALGTLRCALNTVGLDAFWDMVRDRPGAEWYDLIRNDPRLFSQVHIPSQRGREPSAA
jgi:broad specificity phosphatase PhoE